MPKSCCKPSSTACCNTHGRFGRYWCLLAQNLVMGGVLLGGEKQMSGLLDETGVRNSTSQRFCYPLAPNVCASSHVFPLKAVFIFLCSGENLVALPTAGLPETNSFSLSTCHSSSPSVPPSPGGDGTHRILHCASVCQAFTSLTRILHCFLLKMGSVLQAGGDSRSACLKLSSDSSVCNWYDVVRYFFLNCRQRYVLRYWKADFCFDCCHVGLQSIRYVSLFGVNHSHSVMLLIASMLMNEKKKQLVEIGRSRRELLIFSSLLWISKASPRKRHSQEGWVSFCLNGASANYSRTDSGCCMLPSILRLMNETCYTLTH